MVIYVDVLVFINAIVTYFLLLSVCKIFSIRPKFIRLFFGSILGGVFALIIFWQDAFFILLTLAKLVMCAVIVLITFGAKNKLYFLKYFLSLFAVTTAYGGVALALKEISGNEKMYVANGTAYFDISAIELVALTAVVYLLLRLLLLFKRNTKDGDELFCCTLTLGEKKVSFVCINDTGNALVDPYSSSPVLVVKESALLPLGKIKTRYPIPFSTINSTGLIEIFYPDKLYINDKLVRVAVGIAKQDFSKQFDGLISPEIIQLLEEK